MRVHEWGEMGRDDRFRGPPASRERELGGDRQHSRDNSIH